MKNGTQSGSLFGAIKQTESYITLHSVRLVIDYENAYALCNVLHDKSLKESNYLESDQRAKLSSLGTALGRLVENPSQKNTGDFD